MVFQSLVFGTLVSFSSAVLDRKKLDFVEFWVLLLGVIKLLIVVVGVMGQDFGFIGLLVLKKK
jgi:hypothetical protein